MLSGLGKGQPDTHFIFSYPAGTHLLAGLVAASCKSWNNLQMHISTCLCWIQMFEYWVAKMIESNSIKIPDKKKGFSEMILNL